MTLVSIRVSMMCACKKSAAVQKEQGRIKKNRVSKKGIQKLHGPNEPRSGPNNQIMHTPLKRSDTRCGVGLAALPHPCSRPSLRSRSHTQFLAFFARSEAVQTISASHDKRRDQVGLVFSLGGAEYARRVIVNDAYVPNCTI